MSDPNERAFLRRIRAAPDDDGPRLAYAGWLRQRGDPRGEFIEAECLQARIDPGASIEQVRAARALSDAARWLSSQHPEWTARVREVLGAGGAQDSFPGRFRRGFIDSVTVPADVFAARADELLEAAPLLRELHVSRPMGGDFDAALGLAIGARPELEGIERVRLFGLDLTDDAFVPLIRSPHLGALRGIDLGANRLGPAAVDALLGAPCAHRLTSFDFHKNELGDAGAERIAAAATPSIRGIRLASNGIGARGGLALACSSRLSLVEYLDLTSNPLGDDAVPAILDGPLVALQSLDLHEVDLGLVGIRRLATLPGLARIEHLEIGGNGFADDGVLALARSPYTCALTRIDLEGASLGDDGAQAIAEARDLQRLVELDLRYNRITDIGAKALAASTRLPSLVEIDVAHNDIGCEGHEALEERFEEANRVVQGRRDEPR